MIIKMNTLSQAKNDIYLIATLTPKREAHYPLVRSRQKYSQTK